MMILTTEIIDSSTVQVWSVCLIVKSKYSLNIQKPASLTCDAANEPAPMARTINAGSTPAWAINGATIPAAVSETTVAEPNAIRRTTATNQPRINGEIGEPMNS